MLACRRMQIDPYSSLHKTQTKMDQRHQHKSRYTKPDRRESGKLAQDIPSWTEHQLGRH